MKSRKYGAVLYIVMCMNVAGCAGDSIPGKCMVTQALLSVLGPLGTLRLLGQCRWPSLDAAFS